MKSAAISFIIFASLLGKIYAGVLFSDNFNSYSNGNLPTGGSWSGSNNTSPNVTQVVTDTSNLFQQGVSNKMLYVHSESVGPQPAGITDVATGTLSGQLDVNFYDTVETGEAGGFTLRIGTASGNSATAFALTIQLGSLYYATGTTVNPTSGTLVASYSMSQLNSLSIVFNNDSSILSYAGGTVASQKMDIWLNGVLVGNDIANTGINVSAGTLLDHVNITTKSTTGTFYNSAYFDDISLSNVAVIPEASSLVLSLIGIFSIAIYSTYRRTRLV